ncbi:ABC transporter permease [Nonomuraea sediminis]|uniref:ABC transporter permease n=1 Tax=Nonomuraea sediminis TaxID=2835864 RepID=UPI001BDD9F80|nr:ABC transporter permease [Nonomuraea sediminis]
MSAPEARPMRTVWILARSELVLLARTPVAWLASVALPFLVWLLLMLFIGFSLPTIEFGAMPGVRVIDRLTAEMAGTVAACVGIVVVALNVSGSRAGGMLRRLRRTPMTDGGFIAAQVVVAAALVVASVTLFVAVTFAIYGAPRTWHPLYFAGALAVVAYCTFSVGLLLGGLRLPEPAARVAAPTIFVLLFLTSGMGVPREGWQGVAPWLYQITTVNPLAQLDDFVFDAAYLGRLSATWPAVAGLFVTALVVNVATGRTFDWTGRPAPIT